MAKLYSPENIEKMLISNSGTYGTILRTIAINRDNRFTDIYIKFKTSHLVRPTVYRGFYNENDQFGYYETSYQNIGATSDFQEIVFKYNMLNDENYTNYFITFECLRVADTEIEMLDVGVQFEEIEGTLNNTKSYSTSLETDINKNPLTKQQYNATQGFSTINNRTDVQTILNVVDKPFYLLDEIGEYIDGVDIYGFDFDGITKIDILDGSNQPPQLTFMCWCVFNSDASQIRQVILNKLLDKTVFDINRFTLFSSISSGASYYGIQLFNSSSEKILSVGEFVNDGLHHISLSLDMTTNMYSGCVDGVEVFSGTYVGVYTYDTADWILGIGDHYFNNSKNTISDVKIYDSILTAAQIKEEMKGNVLPTIGYWPLNQNTQDYSGNDNNGVVKGVDVYGFDFDGASYLANNNLDVTQDFAVAIHIKYPSAKPDTGDFLVDYQCVFGGYATDGTSSDSSFQLMIGSTTNEIIRMSWGGLEFGLGDRSEIEIPYTNFADTIGRLVVGVRDSVSFMMIGNTMYTSLYSSSLYENLEYVIGALYKNTQGDVTYHRDFDGAILEYLEIQDTLTDAQILEFSDLDKFSEHSDYSTFNKNAYYDFNNQNTQDYSGNDNNGVVTGAEQYTVVEQSSGTEQYTIVETTPTILPCINNSTKKLMLTSIGFNYITSATQKVSTNIQGITEV